MGLQITACACTISRHFDGETNESGVRLALVLGDDDEREHLEAHLAERGLLEAAHGLADG